MKRYSLILCLVLIVSLSGVASAQVVLGPPATVGGIAHAKVLSYGSTVFDTYGTFPSFVGNVSMTNYPTTVIYYIQGAVEFNLSPAIPPTFTSNNFTARLSGLTASDATGTGTMNIDFYDMGDCTENGAVTKADFNSIKGTSLASRVHTFGGTSADFNSIDVTCAVRQDLFGKCSGDFSGFILKCPNAPAYKWVAFTDTPTLTINTGVLGPNCPECSMKCGDDGGGCFIATSAQ